MGVPCDLGMGTDLTLGHIRNINLWFHREGKLINLVTMRGGFELWPLYRGNMTAVP